jgi:hypothetical protein
MVAENQPSGPPPVQYVGFTNNAGVIVRKLIIDYNRDAATGDFKKSKDIEDSRLEINQSKKIDLSTLDEIKPLSVFRVRVDCVWANDPDPSEAIRYNKNGQAATYSLKGLTGHSWLERL